MSREWALWPGSGKAQARLRPPPRIICPGLSGGYCRHSSILATSGRRESCRRPWPPAIPPRTQPDAGAMPSRPLRAARRAWPGSSRPSRLPVAWRAPWSRAVSWQVQVWQVQVWQARASSRPALSWWRGASSSARGQAPRRRRRTSEQGRQYVHAWCRPPKGPRKAARHTVRFRTPPQHATRPRRNRGTNY